MSNEHNQQSNQSSTSQLEAAQIEQARRQVNQLTEEIAQLAETDLQPPVFYTEFLQRVYFALQGSAAAVWIRTPQGNLQLQCQINLREVGLDRSPEAKPMHDELLRQSALQAKGGIIRPQFSHNFGGEQVAGNPTDHVILLAPILQEKQVIGLVEVWQQPNRDANVFQNLFQFLVRLAAFVSIFQRNHQLRTMLGQQEMWLKLESFSRQIHGSLHVTEVAYLIANEARRLIEVDRISVATRSSDKCAVTAISGADVVEKRSNLVQLMRALFDAVIAWGEKLVYTGTKDESLPPKVVHALDAYLQESNSKILVVMPLIEERDKEKKRPARSALMMECFETTLMPEQLLARLEVVGRHAGPSLYNALEHHRIPMRFIWGPLAYVQDGLGGKAKAITALIATAVVILILAMIFVPFPLKMEADAQALPSDRIYVFSPRAGKVEEITPGLKSGSKVTRGQPLFTLFDLDLAKEVRDLQGEIASFDPIINSPTPRSENPAEANKNDHNVEVERAKLNKRVKIQALNRLKQRTNANLSDPGFFTVTAPKSGIVLSADFRENLLGKTVKPGDPLIRIGATDAEHPKIADWEIELKIPQKHVGQVNRAFESIPPGKELDVDILFLSEPTRSYRAKLRKDKIAKQASAEKNDNNEAEPVVMASARLHGKDIPAGEQVPARLLLSGSGIHTRIRCGDRPMGYSLFYGVWEFAYEKVVFPYGW
ncbi:MAG: hypothetical protein HYX68_01370 [Planctomycetes bacterium]|nr:hypothetical protein [Planctomycetota bacterium]